ncbi:MULTISPECIES: hypothetical protein [unclassified Variovorax]|uniref:hypothetical protein n=1 Tax=unclassified Variovorax TaxID=663243 RepID=UPI001BD59372|nr:MULTISPECIES: hypothetical protein [unclassified Variovorax]
MKFLSRRTAAVLVSIGSVAVWASASAQNHSPVLATTQQVLQAEPPSLGSAIYSPFSPDLFASQEPTLGARAAISSPRAPNEGEPGLTTTLAASMAGAVAFVWLLRRI